MKKLSAILLFCLLLGAVCGVTGCQKPSAPPPDTTEPGSAAPESTTPGTAPVTTAPPDSGGTDLPAPEGDLVLAQDGKSEFTIIIPRAAGNSLKRTAQRLSERFAAFDVKIAVDGDGGVLNQNIPTDTCEILLGNTNRAESRRVKEDFVPESGYICFMTDRRIALKACDEEQLEAAVYEVFGKMEKEWSNGSMIIPASSAGSVNWNENTRRGWLLQGIPAYAGGTLAEALYNCGNGLDGESADALQASKMQLICKTSAEEYNAYLKLLEENGYTEEFRNRIGENLYAGYRLGGLRLYVYYTADWKECRVIWDKGSTASVADFSYSYTPKTDDTSVLYAYALCQSADGLYANNCGQMEVIKLADNSLFVIDGGFYDQFDQAAQDGFVDFARKVTGTPAGEKVRISCWYSTHYHSDHRDGVARVLTNVAYRDSFTVERMAFNYPGTDITEGNATVIDRFMKNMQALYPECQMLKLHTGMKFTIANMQVEVLGTHEDLVTREGVTNIKDSNDSSTILRLTAEDVSFLLLGDMSTLCESNLIANMPENMLQCDIIQVSHHTWNDLKYIYDIAKAPYAIFTQTEGACNRTLGIHARAVLRRVQQYAKPENCFYSGVETTGLSLKNGTVTVKETFPLCWDSPDFKWGYVYEGCDISKIPDYANP